MTKKHAEFRLAFRREGKFWKAYYAEPGTMKGALELGSIHLSLVEDERVRNEFIAVMTAGMKLVIHKATGINIKSWNTRVAPEHEKAGHS